MHGEAEFADDAIAEIRMIRFDATVQHGDGDAGAVVARRMGHTRRDESTALGKRERAEFGSANGYYVRMIPQLFQTGSSNGGSKPGHRFESAYLRSVLRSQHGPHVILNFLGVPRPKVKVYSQRQLPGPLCNGDCH